MGERNGREIQVGARRTWAALHRVLKPGGRLLMVVRVPSWATFSLANVFSLRLTSNARWRTMARAGFCVSDEGTTGSSGT